MVYAGTPGEYVINRQLTELLEGVAAGGGQTRIGDVYLDGHKVGRIIAQPVASEQGRTISYRSARA